MVCRPSTDQNVSPRVLHWRVNTALSFSTVGFNVGQGKREKMSNDIFGLIISHKQ